MHSTTNAYRTAAIAIILSFQLSSARAQCAGCLQQADQCRQNACASGNMIGCDSICQDNLLLCCPFAGGTAPGTITGGSTGAGGSATAPPPLTATQINTLALLQVCDETVVAADVNQDAVLTFQEYQQQLELMTAAICPEVEATTKYETEEESKALFERVTCEMCYGVLDPYNLEAAVDGSYEECGCDVTTTGTTPAASLTLGVHTRLESVVYCLSIYRVIYPRCLQPVKSCADACAETVDQCFTDQCKNLNQEGAPLDAYFMCLETCTPLYVPCIDQCESTLHSNGSSGSDGTRSSSCPRQHVPFFLTFGVAIAMMMGSLF